jgi:hypothetical protein
LATRHFGRGAKAKRAKAGAPRPRGRPTRYSAKIVRRICDKLADGVPLSIVCRADDMPAARTVRLWQQKHPDFLPVITAAREAGADALCDLVLPIVNGATPATVNVARLKFDAIRWLCSKIAPKKYGDRITADVTTTTRLFTTEELVARYRARHAQPNGHDDDRAGHAV